MGFSIYNKAINDALKLAKEVSGSDSITKNSLFWYDMDGGFHRELTIAQIYNNPLNVPNEYGGANGLYLYDSENSRFYWKKKIN